jgi:endonuclease G, mitochondrial
MVTNESIVRLEAAIRMLDRSPIRKAKLEFLSALLADEKIDPIRIEPIERQQTRAKLLQLEALSGKVGRNRAASQMLFEAVIGKDDTLPRRFLSRGDEVARAVGRIVVQTENGGVLFGTGSLISSQLAITNNHVIESTETARSAVIELGYYEVEPNFPSSERQMFAINPDKFFFTSEALDFTIMGIEAQAGSVSTASYGTLDFIPQSGKALIGELVNIIHHAGGGQQRISIRENALVDVFDSWIHYVSDTEPGSSGAPVFNDEWQLVAIHHASVPWGDGQIVNEGVRISAIVEELIANLGG